MKIIEIRWPIFPREEVQQERVKTSDKVTLELYETDHGDHSEEWVRHKVNGKEIARYKTQYLEAIIFEEEKIIEENEINGRKVFSSTIWC
jgi:beta-glucanase (GH16 family)